MSVISGPLVTNAAGAASKTFTKSNDPTARKIMNMANSNPKSPIRFMMNAFLPAVALASSSNQNPMRR